MKVSNGLRSQRKSFLFFLVVSSENDETIASNNVEVERKKCPDGYTCRLLVFFARWGGEWEKRLQCWMVLGLYQSVKQEHLKDQDRQYFNQGIRRSLVNGLLLSLISAIIISAIGVLDSGLSFALSSGLRSGLTTAALLFEEKGAREEGFSFFSATAYRIVNQQRCALSDLW
jgi:hypothetical protein